MAGVITHMVIAREIEKQLPPGTIKDPGLFYLGNLAPDAIHARENYQRAYKRHTHFRDDILDKDFELEKNRFLFQQRLTDFILKNRDRTDGLLDLYRGYVCHIITDELFLLSIRKEFCSLMETMGILQHDSRFFDFIVTDMNRNDLLLVHNYEDSHLIRSELEQVPVHPVIGYLTELEMRISRDWLIHRHFIEENDLKEPLYISYDRTVNFIQMASAEIIKELTQDCKLPRMF